MSDIDIKAANEAVEKLNKAWEAQKETMDELSKEMKDVQTERPETKAKLEKIEADLEKANKTAEDAYLAVKRSQRVVTDANGNEIDLDAKAQEWADITAASYDKRPFQMDAKAMSEYKDAQAHYLRKGLDDMGPDERKALSSGGDATGGYVVYPDMSGQVITKVFETSPMRAFASVQVISTDALKGLYDLDEADAGWAGETTPRTGTSTPEIGEYRIPVHELWAFPKATQNVLDDAAINLESWLAGKVADRFARKENAAFVNGTGAQTPRGFLTYADGTTLPGQIERVKTTVNGGFAAAPNGGDVLIDALYGLKAPYRANATWFMNRVTAKTVRKLKDTDGSYIWTPGIAAGQPATLLGYPTASFEDMPDPATGSLSIAVGDMRSAYQIVDRQGIRVLRDPFTAKPYVAFYTKKRTGGAVVNFEAIKLVEFSS